MIIIRFNWIGLAMFVAALAATAAILHVIGTSGQGPAVLLGGALLVLLDLGVRRANGARLFSGRGGGTIMYLPVWMWGMVWTGLGALDCLRGR